MAAEQNDAPPRSSTVAEALANPEGPEVVTARIYFVKARDEAIQRLSHREQGLFVFMGALAGLVGILLAHPAWYVALLLVPFLSLGTALLLIQHDLVVGMLSHYQKEELSKVLGKVPQQWERSTTLVKYGYMVVALRRWAHLALLVIPAGLSLLAAAVFFTNPGIIDALNEHAVQEISTLASAQPREAPMQGEGSSKTATRRWPWSYHDPIAWIVALHRDEQLRVAFWTLGLVAVIVCWLVIEMVGLLREDFLGRSEPDPIESITRMTWKRLFFHLLVSRPRTAVVGLLLLVVAIAVSAVMYL